MEWLGICIYCFLALVHSLREANLIYSDYLRAARSGYRISVGSRLYATFQTGPGAHPAYYKIGTGYLSRGLRRPGRGVNHPPPSSAEVKERVELYFYNSPGPSWPVPE